MCVRIIRSKSKVSCEFAAWKSITSRKVPLCRTAGLQHARADRFTWRQTARGAWIVARRAARWAAAARAAGASSVHAFRGTTAKVQWLWRVTEYHRPMGSAHADTKAAQDLGSQVHDQRLSVGLGSRGPGRRHAVVPACRPGNGNQQLRGSYAFDESAPAPLRYTLSVRRWHVRSFVESAARGWTHQARQPPQSFDGPR